VPPLDVSPSGYYAWRKRPLSSRARADVELTAQIHVIHLVGRRQRGRGAENGRSVTRGLIPIYALRSVRGLVRARRAVFRGSGGGRHGHAAVEIYVANTLGALVYVS